jgi:biotin transport system substrate-specific component
MTSSSVPASRFVPVIADRFASTRVREVALVVGFAVAIALSAQVAFPLPGTPVPVTGQTFAVLLGAAALGPRRATLGAALFMAVGLAGVPWFAITGGATLGYIAGFIVAAAVVGTLARRGWVNSFRGAAAAMIVGNVVIYSLGVTVLSLVTGLGLSQAFMLGAVPFFVGDAIKIALATVTLPVVQRYV